MVRPAAGVVEVPAVGAAGGDEDGDPVVRVEMPLWATATSGRGAARARPRRERRRKRRRFIVFGNEVGGGGGGGGGESLIETLFFNRDFV